MTRCLILPALLLISCFVGCGEETKTKTQDPAEIERIRQKALEDSRREIQGTPPPPASTSTPAN
jgi:hypothetical protein